MKITTKRFSFLKNQAGFTIVELMIATLVFSVVLIILTESLLDITNSYYKGITQTNTQNVARNVVNTVAQAIEYNGAVPTPLNNNNGTTGGYCIGNQLFSYLVGYEVEDNPSSITSQMQAYHGLVVSQVAGCSSSTQAQNLLSNSLSSTSQELLSPDIRLASFSITPVDTENNLYEVSVSVVYGAIDLSPSVNGAAVSCKDNAGGSQFCAVSDLSSIVQMRLQ